MAIEVLEKQPGEKVVFDFDFSNDIAAGVTIASITSIVDANCGCVAGSSALTLSGNAFSGRVAQTTVTGGTHGESYKLTATVVDTAGQIFEHEGIIEVIEK